MTDTSFTLKNFNLNDQFSSQFDIEDLHFSYINSIRRIILQHIPTYGFLSSDITITDNNSMLNNQYLGHRISLLPLFNPNGLPLQDYIFSIDKKNPNNQVLSITTDDFEIKHKDTGDIIPTQHIFPHDPITNDPILLVKLNPRRYNEKIKLQASPILGIGKMNAGFQCTSQASYKFIVDEEKAESEFQKKIEPNMSPEDIQKARNLFDTLEKKRYYYQNDNGDASKVQFLLESIGPIPVQNIPVLAINAMVEKLQLLKIELSKVDSDKVLFQKSKKHQIFTSLNTLDYMFNSKSKIVTKLAKDKITIYKR